MEIKEEIKRKCDKFIENFNKFSKSIKFIGNEVDNSIIFEFNKKFENKIPSDFLYILKNMNGFSLMGTEVLGFHNNEENTDDLTKIYHREHFLVELTMPDYFIPFSPDGYGNYYCLDISRYNEDDFLCPIVFWEYGHSFVNGNDIETSHSSFIDWLEEVIINWTLEDYNYDGTQK